MLFELTKLITPLLTGLVLFFVHVINDKIDETRKTMIEQNTKVEATLGIVDARLFKHFTNEEIHMPRAQIVNIADFQSQCKLVDQLMCNSAENIREIRMDIKELREEIIAELSKK